MAKMRFGGGGGEGGRSGLSCLAMQGEVIISLTAATTPALKSTLGTKPSVSSRVSRKPRRSTTLLTQWSE
jgi:hypothetical protein